MNSFKGSKSNIHFLFFWGGGRGGLELVIFLISYEESE